MGGGRSLGTRTNTLSQGLYRIALQDGGVVAELTAGERSGHHRYTMQGDGTRHVVVDPTHALGEARVDAFELNVRADGAELDGWIDTRGRFSSRSDGFRTHFAMRVSPTPDDVLEHDGGAVLSWTDAPAIDVQVGISYVDADGAWGNLDAEQPTVDFDSLRLSTRATWEEQLDRIRVVGGTAEEQAIFATALYHSMVMPTRFTDADGRYRGFDGAVHDDPGFEYFTNLSMWDTYRTVHSWFALAFPELQLDMVRSLIQMSEQGGGYLPRWPMGWGYTSTTIGSSPDIVIAETYLKGVTDFEADAALDAMIAIASGPPRDGHPYAGRGAIEEYIDLGYVPADVEGLSVSRTLEQAIADDAIARFAEALGRGDEVAAIGERAGNYANLWDAELRVFRGRLSDGSWITPFDRTEYESGSVFYGGNGVQHTWLVPHDLPGLIELFESPEAALADLEQLFDGEREEREILGNLAGLGPPTWYYHGNEPDLHAAWVFLALGRPDLTQFWSDWVADELYAAAPNGIAGNEDMGALSVWYVWSAIGLYPLAGTDMYLVGRPAFERVEVDVERGTLVIDAPGAGEDAIYVSGLSLNGVPLDRPWLFHDELVDGALLEFAMSSEPSEWGSRPPAEFLAR